MGTLSERQQQLQAENEQARQRLVAFLDDPERFAWGQVFAAELVERFAIAFPAALLTLHDEALEIAGRAAECGRPEIAKKALWLVGELTNDIAWERESYGHMERLLLDRLRADLRHLLAWMEQRERENAERHASEARTLAALRQQLEQPKEAA